MGKTRRGIACLVLVVLNVLLAIYIAGARFYTDRFPAHTIVNGIDIGGKTLDMAVDTLEQGASDYVLTILERDNQTEAIRGKDLGMVFDCRDELGELLDQYEPAFWVTNSVSEDAYNRRLNVSFDEDYAIDYIQRLHCFDPDYYKTTENAKLSYSNGKIVIKEEVRGSELRRTEAQQAILSALRHMDNEIDLEAKGLYLEPEITAESITQTEEYQRLQTWLDADLSFDFEDGRIERINGEKVKEWIVKDENWQYVLDVDAVFEWVKTNLAYRYDTFGLTHEFKTHTGETIELKGGDYGWCIARQDTTDKIIRALTEGYHGTIEPEYQYTALHRGINDIGDTYVEVSIDEQKLWCYKDGELVVETPIVTGNPNRGNGTPRGSVWAFDSHKSPATLGTMETMGYSSKVTYWMSFTGNVGIHDADGWRSRYGGNIYKSNGSHGCINCPKDAAELVYKTVNVGYPVIVY